MTPNFTPQALALLVPVIIWSLAWKGAALWKAARNGHTAWFVVLLVLNTVGMLDIVYILGFSKKNPGEASGSDMSPTDSHGKRLA